MTQAEKTVLKSLLDEVIGLRAALVVLAERMGDPGGTSILGATNELTAQPAKK